MKGPQPISAEMALLGNPAPRSPERRLPKAGGWGARPRSLALGLFLLLSLPPVDPYLEREMTGQMLGQIPLLLLLGALLARRFRGSFRLEASWAFGLLVLSLGTTLFWMIPRSLDLAVSNGTFDLAMHLCLLAAGFGLGTALLRLNLIFKIALGIYGTSMWSSFALILVQSASPVCARFTLEQQQQAGQAMLWAAVLFLVFHVGFSIWMLVRGGGRPEPEEREPSAPRQGDCPGPLG